MYADFDFETGTPFKFYRYLRDVMCYTREYAIIEVFAFYCPTRESFFKRAKKYAERV